jgi:hypothetical protein
MSPAMVALAPTGTALRLPAARTVTLPGAGTTMLPDHNNDDVKGEGLGSARGRHGARKPRNFGAEAGGRAGRWARGVGRTGWLARGGRDIWPAPRCV